MNEATLFRNGVQVALIMFHVDISPGNTGHTTLDTDKTLLHFSYFMSSRKISFSLKCFYQGLFMCPMATENSNKI